MRVLEFKWLLETVKVYKDEIPKDGLIELTFPRLTREKILTIAKSSWHVSYEEKERLTRASLKISPLTSH